MTPKTFRYEEEGNKKTEIPSQFTPEQIEQRVLDETLKLSGLTLDDLKKFYNDCTSCNLDILKEELKTTPAEKLIEEKSKELYKAYLETELNKHNGVENTANLDFVTKSIESERIQNMKNEFEEVIDASLGKYDFLDKQTKNLIKLSMANSMLKGSTGRIIDSTIGSFNGFIANLLEMDSQGIDKWLKNKKETPKDAGRTLGLEEKFQKQLGIYLEKFDEIQEKLKTSPELNQEKKQNIISHIDWFRNPVLIEAGVEGLDVSKIDLSKTDKKVLTEEEKEAEIKNISEYMISSRENLVSLSKKMVLGDKGADLAYSLIGNGGKLGEGAQKLFEIIFDLPIIGKLFAMFLGLDPNKAKEQLKENSDNLKYLSSLKDLGGIKNKEGKIEGGKEPFTNIDLSEIRFNIVKKEIKEVKAIFGEEDEEKLSEKWQKAFKDGIQTEGGTFKLEFGKKDLEDKKLTSLELKEILKNGLGDFNGEKEKKQAEVEQKKLQERMKIETSSLKLLNGSSINGLSSILGFGNFNDFKNIKLDDLSKSDDIDNILKNAIGESDYEKIKANPDVIDSLKDAVSKIKEFLNSSEGREFTFLDIKSDDGDSLGIKKDIGDLINYEGFEKFLSSKVDKIKLAENIGGKINEINSPIKLSDGIDIDQINIKLVNGELKIGSETFQMSGSDATITDIVIDATNDVKFEGRKGIFTGKTEIGKEKFINGLQELVLNGKYEFIYNKGKKIKIEKV